MQDIALDANGGWIKCVLNMKNNVFHTIFRKYLNLGTSENFQKIFFVQICFLHRIFFFDKNIFFCDNFLSKNFSLLQDHYTVLK